MRRWAVRCMMIVLAALLVTGCWNRRELNELAIAVAMGIDWNKDGYTVSIQIINAQEVASKDGTGYATPVAVLKSEGQTIFEAIRKATTKLSRKVYLSHMRMVIFGEELAKRGIGDALDFISRDHEMRTDFYMAVARQARAEDVISVLTSLEKVPANKLFASIELSKNTWATTTNVTLDRLLSDMLSKGKNPAIAGITIIGQTATTGSKSQNVQDTRPLTVHQYTGVSVFNMDRLVGWLNEDESRGFNYVINNVKSTIVNISCPPNGKVGVELVGTEPGISVRMENGRPIVDVELKTEGSLGDVECGLDVSKEENIQQLESVLAQAIRRDILASIQSAKKMKSDIFGFGNAVHRYDPHVWEQWKPNWHKEFVDLPVEVQVDAQIRRTGTITNSLKKELKE